MVRLLLLIPLFLSYSCAKDKTATPNTQAVNTIVETLPRTDLFRGVSYESPSSIVGSETFDSVDSLGGNSVAIIPFGFITSSSSTVSFNSSTQWWGETDEGVATLITYAKEHGNTVMIKPQVWIWGGDYTGDYEPLLESEWQNLENTYYDYILHFADLADSLNCELFCVGTEWKKFHQQRPAFWSKLIDSTRSHFSGALTYAGNWDSYDSFIHWSKLDYIGIDAYFPVSATKNPTITECYDGWEESFKTIKAISIAINKPVLFTEFGYRSVDYCGQEPWVSSGGNINLLAQQNAYQGLFNKFWNEPWFKGGFLWKWEAFHSTAGGENNTKFTPQNKPAEQAIKNMYRNL